MGVRRFHRRPAITNRVEGARGTTGSRQADPHLISVLPRVPWSHSVRSTSS
jgi:hypothetical protein